MNNSTYLLVSPNFSHGHFSSWHNLIIEILNSQSATFYEITNETRICQEIYSDNRNSVKQEDDFKVRTKVSLRHKYILFIKKQLVVIPVLYGILKKIYIIIERVIHKNLRSNSNFSQPRTKLEVALKMSEFIPGRIKLIHFYAEDLNSESTSILRELNESQIEIHLFAFDLSALNREKILTLSNCKSFGVSNEYSLNWLADNLGSTFTQKGYVIPDFPISDSVLPMKVGESSKTPTILLIGDISERKNLQLFLQAALSDSKKEYLWKIVGKVHEDSISLKSRRLLQLAYGSSNISINNNFVSNDDFVSEISKCTFVYLMYKNWLWGSNVATHAVQFKKFCLISPNTSLEQMLENTHLGIIVKKYSVKELMNAIELSSFQTPNSLAIENILQKHSRSNFEDTFYNKVMRS